MRRVFAIFTRDYLCDFSKEFLDFRTVQFLVGILVKQAEELPAPGPVLLKLDYPVQVVVMLGDFRHRNCGLGHRRLA